MGGGEGGLTAPSTIDPLDNGPHPMVACATVPHRGYPCVCSSSSQTGPNRMKRLSRLNVQRLSKGRRRRARHPKKPQRNRLITVHTIVDTCRQITEGTLRLLGHRFELAGEGE